MRKRYRVLLLAAIVAALVVPVGYALSIDPAPMAKYARTGVAGAPTASIVSSPMLIHSASAPSPAAASGVAAVPDSAKLLLVGTVLFGLAAMVRKAI